MKVKIYIYLFICLIISSHCWALNSCQKDVLKLAFEIGQMSQYPEIIQGIVMQETHAGLLKGSNGIDSRHKSIYKKTYGVMCIKIHTFRDVNRYFRLGFSLSDQEVIKLLKTDNVFNIYIGTLYFKYLLTYFHNDVKKALLAYNVGMGNVSKYGLEFDPNGYIKKVYMWIERIKKEKINASIIDVR